MTKNNTNLETQKSYVSTKKEPASLSGTLIFTMFVGLFIVVSWSLVFLLFLNRM